MHFYYSLQPFVLNVRCVTYLLALISIWKDLEVSGQKPCCPIVHPVRKWRKNMKAPHAAELRKAVDLSTGYDILPPKVICVNERIVAIVKFPKNTRCIVRCNECAFDMGQIEQENRMSCHIGINQCGTIDNNGFYENEARIELYNGAEKVQENKFLLRCPRKKIFTMPHVPIEVVPAPEPLEIQVYNAGEENMDVILKFQKVFTDKVYFGRNHDNPRCVRRLTPQNSMVVADNIPRECGFHKKGNKLHCDMFLGNPKKRDTPFFKLVCNA